MDSGVSNAFEKPNLNGGSSCRLITSMNGCHILASRLVVLLPGNIKFVVDALPISVHHFTR